MTDNDRTRHGSLSRTRTDRGPRPNSNPDRPAPKDEPHATATARCAGMSEGTGLDRSRSDRRRPERELARELAIIGQRKDDHGGLRPPSSGWKSSRATVARAPHATRTLPRSGVSANHPPHTQGGRCFLVNDTNHAPKLGWQFLVNTRTTDAQRLDSLQIPFAYSRSRK